MDQTELRRLENQCTQEHAPTCTAACPLHVDGRAMLAAVQQNDFALGLKILRKTVPFPGILSHICEEPCRPVCVRGQVGDALAIAALEKACVAYGGEPEKPKSLPPKSSRVAVVGGGLSGMTVAYDLARKGYRVTIFEASGQLGGSLWEIPQERLPWQVILSDLGILDKLGVEILLNMSVSKVGSNGHRPPLRLLCDKYDAVYLGIGAKASDIYDLQTDLHGYVQINPLTYQTSQDGVFAGGGMLHAHDPATPLTQRLAQPAPPAARPAAPGEELSAAPGEPPAFRSAVYSIMDGRRAATSIDRYLQKVSLTAARVNEGPYTTRLFTSIAGIPALPVVEPDNPRLEFSPEEAVQEAQRCIQCECMECVKVCEYLKHYGGYPKKYVREIYNNLSIVMGTRYSNKFINSCSLCGLCGEVCPEDLNMASVCHDARQMMVEQKRMPPSAHDFALRDMAFSNSAAFALARSPAGQDTCTYAFFPGCQLSASSPEYVQAVYAYLGEKLNNNGGVGLFLRCCGAPADWSGRRDLFLADQAEFMAEYERVGRPKLVLACSSCYQVFKTHYPSVEIVSLWELIDTHGLPGAAQPGTESMPLAIHDPCATRYETGIQDSARNILSKLGYPINELPLNRTQTECCSYGGLMWLANPELASASVRRRIAASPDYYVTYCAMCRDFFARQGKPSLHLLDLIYGHDLTSLAHRAGPGFSQRHENRARLKSSLLRQFWGETMNAEQNVENPYQNIRLIISPDIQELLESRLILVEDIQQVIEFAERTGKHLVNKQTGRFLAYHKPVTVTYWVEYTRAGEAFVIHNAYSHRMEIGEEGKR